VLVAQPTFGSVFADMLSFEEADALISVDGCGLTPEMADLFHSTVRSQLGSMMSNQIHNITLMHGPRWLPGSLP
jgi:hypothetical protein